MFQEVPSSELPILRCVDLEQLSMCRVADTDSLHYSPLTLHKFGQWSERGFRLNGNGEWTESTLMWSECRDETRHRDSVLDGIIQCFCRET
eukprot:6283996-Amphidinium_carterae.2